MEWLLGGVALLLAVIVVELRVLIAAMDLMGTRLIESLDVISGQLAKADEEDGD